jgi:hypothetical protein
MNGTCKDRPELPGLLLQLEAIVVALPAALGMPKWAPS